MSCIKGLNKITGIKLYSLKDKTYSTFFELLIDCKENAIGIADLTILIKLNFFSEFGSIGKLLKFVEIYNELYQKKIIKKDKEYLVKKLYLKEFCAKETEKQYTGFDSYKCLISLIDKMADEDISIKDKLLYQLQYFGYVDIVDTNINKENADSEKIYDYLVMLSYMLAVKRHFFNREDYYDRFANYFATIIYNRMTDKRQFLPEDDPN